ncbi:trypsin-like serine peptidase [Tunturiibacter gelidoferens]|uniref:S1-C subfamily serine protease n=1 Tax=Tunturiibacter gelidiferens TaxID=3069689 RepID=A0ACC5P3S1_9BACT|nr:trypsin-like peptidase domain-containing protein [Edaphobacter lichenicola]MBB5341452.1 S1-C subfamily serine protease [Edaphobacter lichenicola]
MNSLSSNSSFAFDRPAAMDLLVALCELYPSSKAAELAAAKIGISQWQLTTGLSPYLLWAEILAKAAAKKDGLHDLIANTLAENPDSQRREFFNALLANDPKPPLNHDSVKPSKTPETLLFHDDLTLPISEVPVLIGALEKLVSLEAAICKIEVNTASYRGFGTAFRITHDLLLTNRHVLFLKGEKPEHLLVTFGYQGTSAGSVIECDPSSAKADAIVDWGIIKTKQSMDDAIPIISLRQSAVPPKGDGAFVIQRPAGDRKRVAYARNRISFVDSQVVHYTSDTQTGSSGAPVFNVHGKLIALHRAGGDPQEVIGQAPIRMNEGVRIELIVSGLEKIGVVLPDVL